MKSYNLLPLLIWSILGCTSISSISLKEKDHTKQIAKKLTIPEENVNVRTIDGSYVDLVGTEYCYEVEWIAKWKESIGQSLLYASTQNKKPGVILLYGKGGSDLEKTYYLRCLVAAKSIRYNGESVKVLVYDVNRKQFRNL